MALTSAADCREQLTLVYLGQDQAAERSVKKISRAAGEAEEEEEGRETGEGRALSYGKEGSSWCPTAPRPLHGTTK